MGETDEIDEAQAKQIEERIRQAFAFMRDVVDQPTVLDKIPDGSQLAFRDEKTAGHQVRLTAARRPNTDPKWTARITGHTKPPSESPESSLPIDFDAVATGETAEAALDVLAARIHSFWLADQAIEALRFLAELLPRAAKDPYLWKWVVSAMHDALHGFMGLALRGSHGAQLLTPEDEQATYRRWNEERRIGRPIAPSGPRRVDSFLNLYRKIQDPERMGHYVHSRAFTPTESQTEAVEALDTYWNSLTFYSDTTLVLGVSWFPTMILESLSVVEWLVKESNTMTQFPEDQERAEEMIRRVKEAAHPLIDLFAEAGERA